MSVIFILIHITPIFSLNPPECLCRLYCQSLKHPSFVLCCHSYYNTCFNMSSDPTVCFYYRGRDDVISSCRIIGPTISDVGLCFSVCVTGLEPVRWTQHGCCVWSFDNVNNVFVYPAAACCQRLVKTASWKLSALLARSNPKVQHVSVNLILIHQLDRPVNQTVT